MLKKVVLPVIGMACSACSSHVEKQLNALNGVQKANVNLVQRCAFVEYDDRQITLVDMKKAINNIGYDMVIDSQLLAESIQHTYTKNLLTQTTWAWVFAIVCMAVSMQWIPIGSIDVTNQIALLLSLACMVVCGKMFYVSAWRQLWHRSTNMNTLVALSTLVTFTFSAFNTFWGSEVWGSRDINYHTYFETSNMIIAFVLTGKLLEERAKTSTSKSIKQLMGLAPKTARIIKGDTIAEVPIATIAVGDELEVRAGDKIPVDGVVTWANSFMLSDGAYINESMITGEPMPILKQENARVLAGTVVSQGKLHFKAQQIGEQTALAQIIKMVQQAQASKAHVQRLVDKAAAVFVPVIMILALITFLLWWLIGGNVMLAQAIMSAVSVLVIACPCAMGLATPTALMVGIGKAAKQNVLIKDAQALERLCKVNAMVIDKTGTLTIPNEQIDFTKTGNLSFEQRETLKPYAKEAINMLQNQIGIEVYMMSGDRDDSTRYWANRVGIAHYHSNSLSQDKENLVRALKSKGKTVAMVGDGINDTQALALADVSIAMGKGTDVAMDVAQVTLMGNDLRRIPQAIQLSKQTESLIWQNLFWAFVYNLVCIPLAAGVPYLFGIEFQITPMWSSALMALSSVSVVLNSGSLTIIRGSSFCQEDNPLNSRGVKR